MESKEAKKQNNLYNRALCNIDSWMPMDNPDGVQDEYFEVMRDKHLLVADKVRRVEEIISAYAKMDVLRTYMHKDGNIQGLASYIVSAYIVHSLTAS